MISKWGWKVLETISLFKNSFFELRSDKCETSSGKIVPKYFVIDFPDWVQVVALTGDRKLVVVEQYRYATNGTFVEFPGGSSHPGKTEDPLLAAQRELKEETGYESSNWTYLGYHYPNPALMTNKCHVYLARDCVKTSELNLDPFEELEVRLVEVGEFRELLTAGGAHSLMLATYEMARERLG